MTTILYIIIFHLILHRMFLLIGGVCAWVGSSLFRLVASFVLAVLIVSIIEENSKEK